MSSTKPQPNHRRGIKSYVLRTARMTTGQRQAYQKLYPLYGLPDGKIDPREIFPEAKERILEIGFGMGASTIELALLEPQNAFIGVEVHTPGVGKVLSEIDNQKLQNLRVVHQDINLVLPRLAPTSFDGIHVFFPDPWQKNGTISVAYFRLDSSPSSSLWSRPEDSSTSPPIGKNTQNLSWKKRRKCRPGKILMGHSLNHLDLGRKLSSKSGVKRKNARS
jgi:hypothetical protein